MDGVRWVGGADNGLYDRGKPLTPTYQNCSLAWNTDNAGAYSGNNPSVIRSGYMISFHQQTALKASRPAGNLDYTLLFTLPTEFRPMQPTAWANAQWGGIVNQAGEVYLCWNLVQLNAGTNIGVQFLLLTA